jgi:hypothetical protein
MLRDSWINIIPLNAKENLLKSTKVDFKLYEEQLIKAKTFILNDYKFSSQTKADMIFNYENISHIFLKLNSETKWRE